MLLKYFGQLLRLIRNDSETRQKVILFTGIRVDVIYLQRQAVTVGYDLEPLVLHRVNLTPARRADPAVFILDVALAVCLCKGESSSIRLVLSSRQLP